MWQVLKRAADLVAPQECAGCGAENERVCGRCRQTCDGPVRFLSLRATETSPPIPVSFVTEFNGPAARMLRALKDGDRPRIARDLAPAFARSIAVHTLMRRSETPGRLTIVPVPASPAGRRRRGYDHVDLLLREMRRTVDTGGAASGALKDLVIGAGLVRRSTQSLDQRELGVEARWRNAQGAWSASSAVSGREILLVDDVVTTGASLSGITRAVETSGGRVRGCAVIAATRLRSAGGASDTL